MIAFTVKGIPIPQGSLRAFVLKMCKVCGGGRRAVLTSDNPRLKQWRKTVSAEAQKAMGWTEPAGKNVPIRLEIIFYLPRAKSNKALDAIKKPDLSKLLRAAEDSMSKIVYTDDSQVTEVHCFKTYGEPRAEIRVEEVGLLPVELKHEPIKDSSIPF